ncbi:hypothetical protein ACFS5J_10445 [Flavobacterium chuncheonense]|uniref:Outer membrane protein beta-barrel domain-containing protein n=1 Tax=Flavobacterium chuncheonense TaxID=2026653 RepID=A0ABW5YN31_9FLAO
MKSFFSALFLGLAFMGFAQEETQEKDKAVSVDYYFGIGLATQKYDLNTKLRESNVAQLKTTYPQLNIGMNIFGEKFSGDGEMGFFFSKDDNATTETKNIGFDAKFRVHYNVLVKEKIALTTGLSIGAFANTVAISSRGNSVDLDDLNPANNSGLIELRNEIFYAGPSVSFYLFNKSKVALRANVGYEIPFTNGKWKSDYASINNTVKEIGNNRLVFGITIM